MCITNYSRCATGYSPFCQRATHDLLRGAELVFLANDFVLPDIPFVVLGTRLLFWSTFHLHNAEFVHLANDIVLPVTQFVLLGLHPLLLSTHDLQRGGLPGLLVCANCLGGELGMCPGPQDIQTFGKRC